MASTKKYSIRVERQPHRDAVARLRTAYRKLRSMSQTSSATVRPSHVAAEATHTVQEVSS